MLDTSTNEKRFHKDNTQQYQKYTFCFKRNLFSKSKIIDNISEKINTSRAMRVIPTTFQNSWTSINRGFHHGID
jgi:hypothetical protein